MYQWNALLWNKNILVAELDTNEISRIKEAWLYHNRRNARALVCVCVCVYGAQVVVFPLHDDFIIPTSHIYTVTDMLLITGSFANLNIFNYSRTVVRSYKLVIRVKWHEWVLFSMFSRHNRSRMSPWVFSMHFWQITYYSRNAFN